MTMHGRKIQSKPKFNGIAFAQLIKSVPVAAFALFLCLTGCDSGENSLPLSGETEALFVAASTGDRQQLGVLLKKGGDPNARSAGANLLSVAAASCQSAVLTDLIRAGATVDLRNSSGATPLVVAAATGCTEAVIILHGAGAKLDAATEDGGTALWQAVKFQHLDCVEILLKLGANPNIPDKHQRTPLMLASESGAGDNPVRDMLVKYGAK